MSSSPRTLIVLFDGGCPVCRRTVRTLRRLDWFDLLQFADATDDAVRRRVAPSLTLEEAMRQMNVVDARGRQFGGYAAQLQIGRRVPVLWLTAVLGSLPVVRQLGAAVYRYIAANRRRQGVCSDELCSPQFRRERGSLTELNAQYRLLDVQWATETLRHRGSDWELLVF